MTDIEAAMTLVTPELAVMWLEANTHNRPVRQEAVDKLAGAITAGEWMVNGDAIKFSTDGTLLDGQHRLWAIVTADRPIESLVVNGLEPESQVTMDVGLRRTLKDHLKLRGVKVPSIVAPTLCLAWRHTKGLHQSTMTPTITEALELLEGRPGLVQSAVRADAWRKHVPIPGTVLAYLYDQALEIDPADADDFFTRLSSGADLPADDPRFVLRRWANRQHGQRSIQPQWMFAALTIKAWNYYRGGRKVQNLIYRPGGSNPETFPVMK